MLTRRYGMSGTASDMLKKYMENACISDYYQVKSAIEQQIGELSKGRPSHFCSKCGAIKDNIIAQNEKFNSCYRRNSKLLKLIDDENIKGFMAECIEYRKCVHNRTRPVKNTVTSERASAGKDKQQSRRDSKTSKPGVSQIKGPPGQDQNPTDGKALTKAKPMPQNADGMNSPRNSGENQAEATKQIANPPSTTSGTIETQKQKILQSVHPQVSETDPHLSGSSKGTPNEEDDLFKSTQLRDLGKSISQSDPPNGQIAEGHGVKNQERGGSTPVTKISATGDHADKGVDTDACSKILDGKKTCDEKAVTKDSNPVTSYDASTDLDTTLEEYVCSEDNFDELFFTQLHRGEARDREIHSSTESGNPKLGIVPNTTVLNASTDEDTEPTVLSQGHIINVPKGVSGINTCQTTGALVSTHGCVHSNSVAKHESPPQKEIRSEEHKTKDQVSTSQYSHQVDQSNQQIFAQQVGKLHNKEELSLQEEDRSGAISNGKGNLNDPDTTNIINLIENYKEYIISGLLPLVIFLLLFLLIKCTPLGTFVTKKKGRKRKEMNEKLQRVLSEPSATRESRIPFSYSAFEYST